MIFYMFNFPVIIIFEACEFFNRLKREHKNVLFILHNTC